MPKATVKDTVATLIETFALAALEDERVGFDHKLFPFDEATYTLLAKFNTGVVDKNLTSVFKFGTSADKACWDDLINAFAGDLAGAGLDEDSSIDAVITELAGGDDCDSALACIAQIASKYRGLFGEELSAQTDKTGFIEAKLDAHLEDDPLKSTYADLFVLFLKSFAFVMAKRRMYDTKYITANKVFIIGFLHENGMNHDLIANIFPDKEPEPKSSKTKTSKTKTEKPAKEAKPAKEPKAPKEPKAEKPAKEPKAAKAEKPAKEAKPAKEPKAEKPAKESKPKAEKSAKKKPVVEESSDSSESEEEEEVIKPVKKASKPKSSAKDLEKI